MAASAEGASVLDFHTHIDEALAYGWIDPPEKLLRLMDEANVERAVVMTYRDASAADIAPLEYVAEAVAEHPDRFIPFARMAPGDGVSASVLLRRAVEEWGFAGLKLHPVTTFQPPTAEGTIRLTRTAAELGIPVLFHCGDETMATPLAIEGLAREVPEAKIVLGHMGGYFHADEAIEVAERHPGIYLETSAVPYPEMIRRAVDAVGAGRVLYGSDGPGCPPVLEVQKATMSNLSEAELQMVLGGSARALLGGMG